MSPAFGGDAPSQTCSPDRGCTRVDKRLEAVVRDATSGDVLQTLETSAAIERAHGLCESLDRRAQILQQHRDVLPRTRIFPLEIAQRVLEFVEIAVLQRPILALRRFHTVRRDGDHISAAPTGMIVPVQAIHLFLSTLSFYRVTSADESARAAGVARARRLA